MVGSEKIYTFATFVGAPEINADLLAASSVTTIVYSGFPITFTDFLKDLGKETETVRCPPNNEPRKILKDPNKAFELYQTEWTARVNAAVKIFEMINVDVNVDIQKKIIPLFNGLNAINGALQQAYNAAYRIYHATPCKDESLAEWIRITKEIIAQSFALSYIQAQLAIENTYPETLKEALDNVDQQIQKMLERLKNFT